MKEESYRHVKATPKFAALDAVIGSSIGRLLGLQPSLQKGKGHTTQQLILTYHSLLCAWGCEVLT